MSAPYCSGCGSEDIRPNPKAPTEEMCWDCGVAVRPLPPTSVYGVPVTYVLPAPEETVGACERCGDPMAEVCAVCEQHCCESCSRSYRKGMRCWDCFEAAAEVSRDHS